MAHELLDKKKAGIYNQSIMDFGATVCKPLPLCPVCPLNTKCVAFLKELIQVLPVKEKSIVKRNRWMYYLVVECRKNFYVRKREGKDIWQNLYEFILIEKNKELPINKLQASEEFISIFGENSFSIKNISRVYRQQLTHQTIHGRFLHIILKKQVRVKDYQLLSPEKIKKLPFPKFINTYLKD